MALEVTTLTKERDLEALSGPWRALLERSDNDLPFLLPEWVSSWWRCFRQNSRLICDSLRVKVVRDRSGELLAVVPLMMTDRPPYGPIRARALGFFGADRYITELRTAIVDPGRQGEVARVLALHLLRDRSWDWLAWEGLERESEFARELERAMPLEWGEPETASVLSLAETPTWEAFRASLKRNIKESLRHCTNSLKRDGLTAHLSVAEQPADVDRALDTFFVLHSMRSQQPDGTPHPDRFAPEQPRRFLREVCDKLAQRGVARVFTLLVNDKPVAARVGFRMPNCLYFYYSGYDLAWSKYSVATTIVAETIKYAIGLGLPRVHLSMGQDVSKSRWGPQTSFRHDAMWVRLRLSSRAAYWMYTRGRESPLLERTVGRFRRRFE